MKNETLILKNEVNIYNEINGNITEIKLNPGYITVNYEKYFLNENSNKYDCWIYVTDGVNKGWIIRDENVKSKLDEGELVLGVSKYNVQKEIEVYDKINGEIIDTLTSGEFTIVDIKVENDIKWLTLKDENNKEFLIALSNLNDEPVVLTNQKFKLKLENKTIEYFHNNGYKILNPGTYDVYKMKKVGRVVSLFISDNSWIEVLNENFDIKNEYDENSTYDIKGDKILVNEEKKEEKDNKDNTGIRKEIIIVIIIASTLSLSAFVTIKLINQKKKSLNKSKSIEQNMNEITNQNQLDEVKENTKEEQDTTELKQTNTEGQK